MGRLFYDSMCDYLTGYKSHFSCLAPTRRRESLVTEGKKVLFMVGGTWCYCVFPVSDCLFCQSPSLLSMLQSVILAWFLASGCKTCRPFVHAASVFRFV